MKKVVVLLGIMLLGVGFSQAQQPLILNTESLGSQGTPSPAPTQKISPGKAALLSLILPGAGEYYAGQGNYTAFFLTSEVLAWGALFANQYYFRHLVSEYKTFARGHAGISPGGKADRFWTDIGKFDNIYDYNTQRERQRLFDELYELTPDNMWQWDSHENRLTYDGKRLHANDIDNQRVYFQLAIVLNHLVSGINALRLARRHNRQLKEQKVSWRMETYRENDWSHYVGLNVNIRF